MAEWTGPSGRPTRRVGIGIVGGGFGSHFPWHQHPDARVVAVCDKHELQLQVLAQKYRCDAVFTDYEDLLQSPDLDAVALFTPAPFHAAMAVAAMNRGMHVLSAVPAGLSVEELELLLETVERTGVTYMMAETSRYRPEILSSIDLRQQGHFGNLFYSEAEYHHSGAAPFAYGTSFDSQSRDFIEDIDKVKSGRFDLSGAVPTWAWGFPPMLYITHCTGMIVPVTGERLTEVTAYGWGDGHEMLRSNTYGDNPFFHTVALFKTSGHHAARVSVGWHIAARETERAVFYGDRGSFIMTRPEGSPNTVVRQDEQASPFGLHGGVTVSEPYQTPDYTERLPAPLRSTGQLDGSAHGGSHAHLVHEFVRSVVEARRPTVDIYEAIAYTLPGIVAHQSALAGGERLPIRDYGRAPS